MSDVIVIVQGTDSLQHVIDNCLELQTLVAASLPRASPATATCSYINQRNNFCKLAFPEYQQPTPDNSDTEQTEQRSRIGIILHFNCKIVQKSRVTFR